MTLEQLQIFVAVAERLHVTQAAQELHLTQSAASAAIAALEARYQVRLFNRVGRGIELSEAGRLFLVEAKAVLARTKIATQMLDDLAGLKRGLIRIVASQTVANYWLPQRMVAFATAYPTIDLHLTVGNTQHVADAVIDGAADLGFAEGRVASEQMSRVTVGGDRLSLYAAAAHPLATAETIDVAALTDCYWVLREAGSGTRSEFEAALAARGIDNRTLKILLELPSNEAVLAGVEESLALTAVSDLAAVPHVAAGRLRRLNFDLVQRSFTLLTHRDRVPSRAADVFIRLLGPSAASDGSANRAHSAT